MLGSNRRFNMTKTLALETTGYAGSIAVLSGTTVVATRELPLEHRSAQSLAPAIHELLADVAWQPRDLDLCAVVQGPGSFTGLRVGIVTAKTWAYLTGAKVVALNTLDVIARQAEIDAPEIHTVLDAGRGQFHAARVALPVDSKSQTLETSFKLVEYESWLAELHAGDWVTGPGISRVEEVIPPGVRVVNQQHWGPKAATVGILGVAKFNAGLVEDIWQLIPLYGRPSAAEERKRSAQKAPQSTSSL
jgi:tRNA threonylcarbamoyladenosine biosynthesis protein TsaB